jgi:hypothetical protein
MVLGYWDGRGLDMLIPGDASTQTDAVNQAIASGGTLNLPNPAGNEQHYEDYARPQDSYPTVLPDDCLTQVRLPHADNCVADFAKTSRSNHAYGANYYGWTWSSDIAPAFRNYVAMVSGYITDVHTYYMGSNLTFSVLKQEIDSQRPMVFLVDSEGDNQTDHFVTVIGYVEGPPERYVYLDTWTLYPHETAFTGMVTGTSFGVWGGWSFQLRNTVDPFEWIEVPKGGWKEIGQPLSLRVRVAGTIGAVSYQWIKNDVELPGAVSSELHFDALALDDTGWYSCRVTDGAKSVHTSGPVFVKVFSSGTLPVGGNGGRIVLIIGLCMAGIFCMGLMRSSAATIRVNKNRE